MKSILFIQHRAPYADDMPGEMLDALLVTAAFGAKVSVLFQDAGVWQLRHQQDGKALERKTLLAQLQALGLYDVDQLFVDARSLTQQGLSASALGLPAEPLGAEAVAALVARHDLVLRF